MPTLTALSDPVLEEIKALCNVCGVTAMMQGVNHKTGRMLWYVYVTTDPANGHWRPRSTIIEGSEIDTWRAAIKRLLTE